MMKAQTKTAGFAAPADRLFAFLADTESLPRWATAFCNKLTRQADGYRVTTPDGEIHFRIDADPETGVIDFWGGPAKDQMMRWPARVVDDGMGGSVFAFTAIQTPAQSDEVFAKQCSALDQEFENIRAIMEGARS